MLPLKPFSPLKEDIHVSAQILPQGSKWIFEYQLMDPGGRVLDSLEPGAWKDWSRVDGLWQSTCFEAFIGRFGEPGYWELNFSPSQHAWNCYRFENYRQPQPPQSSSDFELVEVSATKSHLKCLVHAKKMATPLECGLTAVVRTSSGIHYFALTHAMAKADFHARGSFSLRI